MNLSYATVDFIYHLALTLWLGGIMTLVFLVAPTIFKNTSSRAEAGAMFGPIIRKFQIVQFVCMLVVLTTSMMKFKLWENPETPIVIRYLLIFAMTILTMFHGSVVSRRLRLLKEGVASIEALPESDPRRSAFHRWHKTSTIVTAAILFLGLGALYLS